LPAIVSQVSATHSASQRCPAPAVMHAQQLHTVSLLVPIELHYSTGWETSSSLRDTGW